MGLITIEKDKSNEDFNRWSYMLKIVQKLYTYNPFFRAFCKKVHSLY